MWRFRCLGEEHRGEPRGPADRRLPVLVEYLVTWYAKKVGRRIGSVERRTLERLQAYGWPGNIRELQNVIERAVILCEGDALSIDEAWLRPDAGGRSPRSSPPKGTPARPDLARERDVIEAALADSRGRISGPLGAAAKLGVPRQTLESRIASLGIDRHRFRTGRRRGWSRSLIGWRTGTGRSTRP